jgi:predicted dehydrogenase
MFRGHCFPSTYAAITLLNGDARLTRFYARVKTLLDSGYSAQKRRTAGRPWDALRCENIIMAKPKQLRAGVIGAGAIAQNGHIPGLQKAGVEVAAIVDTNLQRAQDVAAKHNIPHAFADYRELLGLKEIDLVTVGLPNALHAPVSIAAMKAGKHVLCEKPMTISVADAKKMIAASKRYGKLLSINQHMRFDATAQAMRDIMNSGALGKVYLAETKWIRQQGIPGYGGWFTNKDLAGAGALMDIGVHMLDLLMYLLDFPKVAAVKGLLRGELGKQAIGLGGWGADRATEGRFDVDDTAFAVITLKDGTQLRLLVTWAAMGPAEDRITLYGTRGGLDRAGHFSDTPSIKQYSFDEAAGKIAESTPDIAPYQFEGGAWIKAIGSFVDAVRGKAKLVVLPEQALHVIKILDAIAESSRTGREVAL